MENTVTVQAGAGVQTVKQASNDEQLVAIWLHGKSPATIKAYRLDINRLRESVNKPLPAITVGDIQSWTDTLPGSPNRRNRAIMAAKSLFSFAQRIGYTQFNVAAVIRSEKVKNTLGERIIDEATVHRIIILETTPRNKLMLRTLYYAGVRVSELVSLGWQDLRNGVLTVYGKGGKTRHVRLPDSLTEDLERERRESGPVFVSRNGSSISKVGAWIMMVLLTTVVVLLLMICIRKGGRRRRRRR